MDVNQLQGSSRFKRRAIKVEEAQRLLLEAIPRGHGEHVPLLHAVGRRLTAGLAATSDWPPFARSGMDGYAARSADIAHASPDSPVELRVIGSVAAGEVAAVVIEAGTAMRIMTGGAVPLGADTVVMLEQTTDATAAGQPAVLVKHAGKSGSNIAEPGEEFRHGDAIAAPGTLLRPGHAALLGAFGYADVPVYARPRVAVLATGAELQPIEATPAPGCIRDSNSAMLAALIAEAGGEPTLHGRLPDELTAVTAALDAAAEQADIIVTTGGISVGDYDVMAAIVRAIGHKQREDNPAQNYPTENYAEQSPVSAAGTEGDRLLFEKVAMRPGSPTSAAMYRGKPLIALSGNPGACFVGFELFVKPAILRKQGIEAEQALPPETTAFLSADFAKGSPHERFVRARTYVEAGRLYAEPLGFAKSSMMASLPEADALIRIPSGPAGAEQGSLATIIMLGRSPRFAR